MKVAPSWFYILHLTLVSAGFLHDNQFYPPPRTWSGSREQALRTTGCFGNRGSTRPLFARRGHYEQQRIQMQKPKLVPVLRKNPPTPSNVPPKPVKPKCSHLTQTCVPQSGCCDPVASCHCRFFKAICFCRRTNSLSIKKS